MTPNHERKQLHWKLLLTAAVVSSCLIALTAGTAAWISYNRSLTTLTRIAFTSLVLEGKEKDTVPVNLGTMNIQENSKEMPFRIVTRQGAEYILQLAYTTNLPLNYEIYQCDASGNKGEALVSSNKGRYIIKDAKAKTYNESDRVQKNAEPVYWIYGPIPANANDNYYVLVVSWDGTPTAETVINKDTDMIYLSASLNGGTQNANEAQP